MFFYILKLFINHRFNFSPQLRSLFSINEISGQFIKSLHTLGPDFSRNAIEFHLAEGKPVLVQSFSQQFFEDLLCGLFYPANPVFYNPL